MNRAEHIVRRLLEADEHPEDKFDAKAYFMSMAKPGDEPQVLNRFKAAVKAYIKWVDGPEPDIGYMPDHRADFRIINRATSFAEVEAVLARYDSEPPMNFLSMVAQGYFV